MIITRNVDLSVGSVLGLTAYLTGRLFLDPRLPILGCPIGIAFGGVLGLINGALVAFAKVPALVITLGTLYAYRGINVEWAGSDRINASDMPRALLDFGTGSFLFIPVLTLDRVSVLAAGGWYMRNTRAGRELYAIGSDPAAAKLYGLNVTRRVLAAFLVSGASPASPACCTPPATDRQLPGRARLRAGGRGCGGDRRRGDLRRQRHPLGAAFGANLLVTINRALPVLGVPDFWQRAVVGVLIIGAIVLDRFFASDSPASSSRQGMRP